KATKSPATSVGATATTSRSSKSRVKSQDSVESEKELKKTTKIATTTTIKKPQPLHTSKNKEREPVSSKRTTPSPTTKATSTLRAAKQPPAGKAKPNAVLDSYHNVTVSSPPQKRKAQPKQATAATTTTTTAAALELADQVQKQQLRARALSRTLQPEEVLVLKRESAKQRSEREVQQVKQAVAFEVNFEAEQKIATPATSEAGNYSDDFESYESDFETDASTPEEEEQDDEEEEEQQDKEEAAAAVSESEQDLSEAEDSEPTQNPITVIQRDKERKLDSGHYDMNCRRLQRNVATQPYDSFDTNIMANSEQLDSGISSYGAAVSPAVNQSTADVHFGGYVDFVSRPVITPRGVELLRKLRFDQLNYQLFETQPLSYEGYMQSYGKLNTRQLATQTQAQQMNAECQTLELHTRTSWTQHPPNYAGQLLMSCSGDASQQLDSAQQKSNDAFERSLSQLEQLRLSQQQRTLQQQQKRLAKPLDMERLNVFLQKSCLLLGKLQAAPSAPQTLQTGFLNALPVRRIFGSAAQQQLLVTVHECPAESNVYRDDFANLLMVWSLTDASKPLRLLSSWSEVCRVAFSSEATDIIVAGLRDGSIAMWDLRETYSYCSKLDGHLTHFAATQSVVPCLDTQQQQQQLTALDLGAVLDVRSFRSAPKTASVGLGWSSNYATNHKNIQYAALNDSGLLTIWTLVESGHGCVNTEHSSPWARVQLLQSASCDLRDYLERRLLKSKQSAYDKTRSLFQGNVYNDEILRELNETQTLATALQDQGLQGLRFSSIDTGSNVIYVCTNRNFVLCCTRSLKPERFTRIGLHESRFLFPTALCVLANDSYIAVGLSNGSVMILNCNQRQRQRLPPRPTTAMPLANIGPEPETGKSCAIQNIILNERRSFEQQPLDSTTNSYEQRPQTQARCAYELRLFDQQLLLSGSVLRQHLVQALVQSSDGAKLFALSNGTVRIYDFQLDRELLETPLQLSSNVTDIATACGSRNEQQLLLLNAAGLVQLHALNY
ncbi:WD repeat-containing protein 60, partial [Drosophila busckii]